MGRLSSLPKSRMRRQEEARAEAALSAQRREKMALDRIAAAEKAAVTEVRLQAIAIASQAAEAIMRDGLPQDAATGLVSRAIDGLPAALAAH